MPLPLTRHAMGRAGTLPEPAPAVRAAQPEAAEAEVLADEVAADVPLPDEGEPDTSELTVDDEPESMRLRARHWTRCAAGQRQAAHRASADAETIMVAAQAQVDEILAAARERAGRLTAEATARTKRAAGLDEGARTLGYVAASQQAADEADDEVAALEEELGGLPAVIAGAQAELTRLRAEQAGAEADLQAGIEDRDRDAQDEARRVLAAVAAEMLAAERDRESARARQYELQRPDGPLEAARRGQNRQAVAEGLDQALGAAGDEDAAARVAARQKAAERAHYERLAETAPRRVTLDEVRASRVSVADLRRR